MTSNAAADAARNVSGNRAFRAAARAGYAVNGLVHFVIGIIAIGVVGGASGEGADQSGALGNLASSPGGVFILWAVVVGLTALGLWQVLEAILVPARDSKRTWVRRAAEFGKALAYFAVAATALTFARGGSTNSAADTKNFTAALLAAPGGVILVALIGCGVLAIGGYFGYKGIRRKFTDDISVPSGKRGRTVVALGMAGYIAKGIALAIVGILFVVAAFTVDPNESTGLDGALKALAALPFGAVILVAVGLGLIAYGAYSVVRARLARL